MIKHLNLVFRFKKIVETRNSFLDVTKRNELIVLNYIEHLFILASISDFASLVVTPIALTSFAAAFKTCAVTARIKK